MPDVFAHVRWFGIPQYTGPPGCTLVVRINDRDVFDDTLISVIALDDVDPCRIIIEIDGDDGNGMHVMRLEGWDTIRREVPVEGDGASVTYLVCVYERDCWLLCVRVFVCVCVSLALTCVCVCM